ncbi:type II toxin-antitoxin system RelE/ParE family toxin [Pseudomonas sp. PDM20]|uniref:type II toxin-antitoxin system RelE/ParE family toxin n=1 Tax=Pseudomonas sp. PDM20 TaxID=2769254 RepID=UPI0017840694|nr:type II toxin-antitoxin system RelE/ParE family toxin [Pseudomonas sp. PDM20]MBD9681186.1 type II toxin-antitoxin system RelE/ParE family toxin [Pseudomonas sp. PDM20]
MRIEWLRNALRNLDTEASYIAQDNPAAARAFASAVLTDVALLAANPAAGREGRVPGTREWAMSSHPYLIPYRIRGGRLQVLRIFHTRRLPPVRW